MRKLWIVCVLLLSGCACSTEQKPTVTATPDSESKMKEAVDVTGEEGAFGTPIVSVVMKDGKITEVSIDEITGESTKKQMKDSYQLPESAVASWSEQIKYLEDYIVKNGVDQIQTDQDGKAVNEDLLSGCTIQIENYLKTVRKAMNEAK